MISIVKKAYVYGLFDETGIRYIGKAICPKTRYRLHMCDFRQRNHRTNWIKKQLELGKKPELRILEECNINNVLSRECWWISFGRKVGWNLINGTTGGEGVTGRIVSQATRDKIRIANTGRRPTTETLKKLSESHKCKRPWMVGRKHSDDAKKKISLAGKGRPVNPESNLKRSQTLLNMKWSKRKPVEQCDIDGQLINTFRSLSEAAKAINSRQGMISRCCNNERKKHKGFIWRFKI